MKYFLISFFFSFFVGESYSSTFCVQTFNTYGITRKSDPFKINLRYRTQALMEHIEKDQCEMTMLQEIWDSSQKSQLEDRSIDVHFPRETRDIGLATLSKNQVISHRGYDFRDKKPGSSGIIRNALGIGKGFTITTTRRPEGDITFINTHLMHMKVGEGQEVFDQFENIALGNAIQMIDQIISTLPNDNSIVLGGDINQKAGSLTHQLLMSLLGLADAYTDLNGPYSDTQCSYCGSSNTIINGGGESSLNFQLDYIYYRSGKDSLLTPKVAEMNLTKINSINCTEESTEQSLNIIESTFSKPTDYHHYSDHYGVRIEFDQSKHDPLHMPLPPEAAEQDRRRQKAIKILKSVIARIEEQVSEETTFAAKRILNRLEVNNPNDPYIQFLLHRP